MPNKRKDNKGRLLRTGESQRKDLTYMYRYTDMRGKRQCVYADDWNKLREKEKKIQLDTLQGLDISGGDITVTLNVYTHASYTKVADEMAQITAV